MAKEWRVMVVDDDDIYQFTVKIALRSLVNQMYNYTNPVHALNYLKDNQNILEKMPNLILLDINMPLLDGFEFLELFTESIKLNIPIVFMVSSSVDYRDIARAKKIPAVREYMSKPLDTKKLQDLLIKYEH